MNSQDLPAKDAPLTVNEQVIVMSGHETIRVLEVEVDASLPSSVPDGKSEGKSEEGVAQPAEQPEVGSTQDGLALPQSAGGVVLGEQQVVSVEAPAPAVQTLTPAVPVSMSLPQPQAAMPITVQGCPQVLTQESLATLMTGMMAQTGSLGQPLLIPLSMAGSIGGQGGLAVLTLPTTSVATLPAFAAANAAGNLLKLPFAGLQAATVLSSVQPQLHTNAQTMFQPQASIQPMQAAVQQVTSQPTQVTNTQVTAAQMAAAQATQATTTVSQSNLSLAALQTAGLSINPAIINAASLGAQPQFLSSLTSTPIITSAMSNMAGITSQIITNAQGQVIGTLPLLVNPASLAGGAATSTLPLQGLQVQTVTPQLLLNTQGQIIATVGNGPAAVVTSAAVLPKATAPPTLTKPNTQALVTTATQAPVVIAPQPSVLKTATTLSSTVPITCGDIAKVGQLVGKPQQIVSSEEGINLEEIREFAKNFKIRRLSLGLTQTQVGQALTATEGPAYSQSAICRFEKLDITPKSAQKLKPVLEKWLAEAEHWNQKGQQNLMEFVGGEPSKKRKRRTSFTPQAIEVLNSYFEKNALPTGQEITEIARELNYDREVVRVWFCNRRQTLKNTSKINVFQVQ
ncbi:POU domain, class 6, transcription factor 1 isoform X2 [Larimichthys crocea]|uniref:POU domain, class 6, transcription factor 1 isoform X2 n=1 Tax=Larimichthys crocea TaxID=215358 RepID=UPI000900B09B|nr:POU domain, class 6, transcription factor 1 isoform X2 [Larimichthys crocea]XP_019129344.1 POU domain, class 6, transcription factor 1 isoform X2 [Larimichthys crocea]XP_019129345.1 POU domain, class 6, transcription factor 1 isoform X2 [Larimichthys crocea]